MVCRTFVTPSPGMSAWRLSCDPHGTFQWKSASNPDHQALSVARSRSSRSSELKPLSAPENNVSAETYERPSDDSRNSNGSGSAAQILSAVSEDMKSIDAQKAVFVEFMAQVLFNFASCSAVGVAMEKAGETAAFVPLQVVPFHFFLLFVLITATQNISGGHFNPMVSTMMAYIGAIPRARLLPYIGAQLLGASLGSTLQYQTLAASIQNPQHAGIQAVPDGITVGQAFIGEAASAFILMAVVCWIGVDPKGDPKKIPLAMALTVAFLIYIVGPVSSMCINPARAFGPAVASGYWDNHWLWWTAPFVGGFCAVGPYKWFLDRESKAEERKN